MLVCYRALGGPVTIEYYTTTSTSTNTNSSISENDSFIQDSTSKDMEY